MNDTGATSPLMLAMMAGSGGQQGIDPSYAMALPRLQLAQGLIQEGTQTGPVASSKYGGLARVLQALAGNYVMDQATTGLQQSYGQRQQASAAEAANLLGPTAGAGTPAAGTAPAPAAPAPQSPPRGPATSYAPLIASTEQRDGIPAGQLAAGVTRETGGEPNPATAVNPSSGAQGLAQILPSTGAQPGYGVTPLAPGDAFDPNKAIPFAGDYVAARAKAAGLDMTNPAQAAKAWSLYGGDSTGQYGRAVVAAAGGSPGAPAGPGGTPAPGDTPTAPSAAVADPLARVRALQQAGIAKLQSPYPQDHAVGAAYLSAAQLEQERLENTYTAGPNGVYTNAFGKPQFAPRPSLVTTPSGAVLAAGGGQGVQTIAPADNPGAAAFAAAKAGGAAQGADNWHAAVQNGVPGQMNSVTGEFKPTVTGTPRLTTTPAGAVLAAQPGSGAITTVAPADNPGIAGRAQAGAEGAASGTQAAATLPRMVKLGSEAAQGIGTIDSAISQINAAQQGGISTGYFTPALSTAVAAAKAANIDVSKLGYDPSAVSDIQAANKSLALTAGSIMRQILGPDSQITEGKLEQFIHATPGIQTDPQAIQKILGWARSQFVYNHAMALDAMQHADPSTGMIAPNWEPSYYAKAGSFGPIYNPLHGEMEQPSGQGPAAAMPGVPAPPQATGAPASPAVPAPGGYREGQTASGPNGARMVFRSGQWTDLK